MTSLFVTRQLLLIKIQTTYNTMVIKVIIKQLIDITKLYKTIAIFTVCAYNTKNNLHSNVDFYLF